MSLNTFCFSSLTLHNHHETKSQKQQSPSHSKNSLLDDPLRPIVSKQQSSSTNSLVRDSLPSSSVPKLLLKRSSFKPSPTASSMKPNPVLSITDASISSSNTIATDHLLNTHSTMSDCEEIIASRKGKKKMKTKDKPKILADLLPRFNVLRKPSPSSLIDSKKSEQIVDVLKKNRSLKTSQSMHATEPRSEGWIKNIDERTSKKNKRAPSNSKTQGNNDPISHIDSSRCKHNSSFSRSENLFFLHSAKSRTNLW